MLAVVCFCMDRAESKSNSNIMVERSSMEGASCGGICSGGYAVSAPLTISTGHMEWTIFAALSVGILCGNLCEDICSSFCGVFLVPCFGNDLWVTGELLVGTV